MTAGANAVCDGSLVGSFDSLNLNDDSGRGSDDSVAGSNYERDGSMAGIDRQLSVAEAETRASEIRRQIG